MMRAFKLSAALLLAVCLLSGCYVYDGHGRHQPDGPQQQHQKGAY